MCYVLHLMEREGSGYDKMFEIQLRNGKQIPIVKEGIGKEIPYKRVLHQIKQLISEGIITEEGMNRWVRYRLLK